MKQGNIMLKTILFVSGIAVLYYYLHTLNLGAFGNNGAEFVMGSLLFVSAVIYGLYAGA
jgi:hypothetical protein